MKSIFKSFKFEIDPTNDHKELTSKHFDTHRFIFNYYLNKRNIS